MFLAINRIHVRPETGDQLEDLFDQGQPMRQVDGFIEFMLVKQTWTPAPGSSAPGSTPAQEDSPAAQEADPEVYLAITKWTSRTHFQAWVHSDHFKQLHNKPNRPDIFLPGGGPAGYQLASGYTLAGDEA